MKIPRRLIVFFVVWGVASGVMGAPMWAGWIGGLIVSLLETSGKPA